MSKSRQQKRNERAEIVCRELRYFLSRNDRQTEENMNKLFKYLLAWMRVGKKSMYDRPK